MLLALDDSVEFVATWYAVQKIGAVTAEVYTFLQPKDYAYYLDYTRAPVVVVDSVTLERVRDRGRQTRERPTCWWSARRTTSPWGGRGHISSRSPRGRRPTCRRRRRRTTASRIWKFTTGSTGRPKACVHTGTQPADELEGYARGVLGIRSDESCYPSPSSSSATRATSPHCSRSAPVEQG